MKNEEAYASWKRHKPNTQFAVGQLATLLEENDESADAVFGAYLVAKKDLARSMQELLRATLPPSRPAFAEMRSRVSQSLQERFGDRIPQNTWPSLMTPSPTRTCSDFSMSTWASR